MHRCKSGHPAAGASSRRWSKAIEGGYQLNCCSPGNEPREGEACTITLVDGKLVWHFADGFSYDEHIAINATRAFARFFNDLMWAWV